MLLNADQRMVQEAVRAFAQEQLWPNAAAWDKSHTFPVEAHSRAGRARLLRHLRAGGFGWCGDGLCELGGCPGGNCRW